jgi:hypothetical protein
LSECGRAIAQGQTQLPLQLKSTSQAVPHDDAVHAARVGNQWMKSHVHCRGQVALGRSSSVRLDGVDTIACEFAAEAGDVVVDLSGPALQPARLVNSVTASKKDRIRVLLLEGKTASNPVGLSGASVAEDPGGYLAPTARRRVGPAEQVWSETAGDQERHDERDRACGAGPARAR